MRKISILILIFSMNLMARDWGHLVTGTIDTLNKKQSTVGTHLIGYGLTDYITFGIAPVSYIGYQMHGAFLRTRLFDSNYYGIGTDVLYFDSLDGTEESSSPFQQTSWNYKLNQRFNILDGLTLYLTAGYQYFIDDESPFSLRPDPQGRFITFASKTRGEYEFKQKDFNNRPRDPSTTSITLMPSIRTGRHSFINLEYGIVGTNYDYPLRHVGMSINFEQDRSDWSLGLSKTSRSTPYIGRENIFHLETKFQFYI